MLQRLQRVVEAKPHHLAARRERFDLLLRRMPDPRLEPILAEDAARALVDPGVRPRGLLEARPRTVGRRRPTGPAPAWSRPSAPGPTAPTCGAPGSPGPGSTPARPSVLALAQGTAFWSPRGDWRGWLPYEVHRAVAAELRAQGNYPAMREWFRASGSTWTTAP